MSKKGKRIIKLSFLLIFIIFLIVYIEINIRPVVKSVAESMAKGVAVRTINDVVNDTMSENNIKYEDLMSLKTDSEGRVTALVSNVIHMNKLKAEITEKIQASLGEKEELSLSIPLGTLLNQSILSGRGPRVKIKLMPIGYTEVNMEASFVDAGINQTKHQLYLDVNATIRVIMPGFSTSATAATNVPIGETVIIGGVPQNYTNVTEVNDAVKDTVLDITN